MITIQGPDGDEVKAAIADIRLQIAAKKTAMLSTIGLGVVAILTTAYSTLKKQSVFGSPKNSGQPLAQSVQAEFDSDSTTIYTPKKEAGYIEFGTGLYATIGTPHRIYPKVARFLAFDVSRLPSDFRGAFIPREKSKRPLLSGSIGTVLTRSSEGMKARPIWFNPATQKAIVNLIQQTAAEL